MIYNKIFTYNYTNATGSTVTWIIDSTNTANIRRTQIKRTAGTISLTGNGRLNIQVNSVATSLASLAATLDATDNKFDFYGAIEYLKIEIPDAASVQLSVEY